MSAPAPDPSLLFAAIGAVFAFILIIVVITEVSSWLRHRSLLKLLREKPEVAEKIVQPRTQRVKKLIPTMIPKTVKVVVVQQDSQLEDICRFDGELITCRGLKMQFVAPSNYEPRPTLFKKKLYLTFYFTEDGKPLELNLDENALKADVKVPDPRMTEVIVNRKLLQQVFRALGSNIGAVVTGIGLGAMILAALIFFVLPMIGVPVTIGRQPVEVIHVYQQPVGVPPPGNFTPAIPSEAIPGG